MLWRMEASPSVTVSTDTPLPDVYRLVKERSINHVPVVDGDKLVGIISRTDLERVSFINDPNSTNVVEAMWDFLRTENLMTRSLITSRPRPSRAPSSPGPARCRP